jgi:hypothetical protein
VSGYPSLALPVGLTSQGKPAGILMYSRSHGEPKLLAFAFDLEQELRVRTPPQFVGSISDPPNAGICGSLPNAIHRFTGRAQLPRVRIY